MFLVRTTIWKVRYQLRWAQFHWQILSQQTRYRTLMFRRNPYKIHHWLQLNQSHRQVRRLQAPPMETAFPAGIWATFIQPFVSYFIKFNFDQ